MEQREIDNMLLSMIQKHFPSLPLSDEYTDWGKWLGFARAVYEAGRASPASAPEGWKLVPVVPTEGMIKLGAHVLSEWLDDAAPLHERRYVNPFIGTYKHVLAAAPTPPVSEDRWQPIETAPKETTQMFVVVAFGAKVGATPYNSDPWCVWHQRGEFVRWPHKFSPTHWMPLPEAPAMQEDKP